MNKIPRLKLCTHRRNNIFDTGQDAVLVTTPCILRDYRQIRSIPVGRCRLISLVNDRTIKQVPVQEFDLTAAVEHLHWGGCPFFWLLGGGVYSCCHSGGV